MRGSKHTLWEGGTRAATLVWGAALGGAGRVSRALVHVTDWLPTLVGDSQSRRRNRTGHNKSKYGLVVSLKTSNRPKMFVAKRRKKLIKFSK